MGESADAASVISDSIFIRISERRSTISGVLFWEKYGIIKPTGGDAYG